MEWWRVWIGWSDTSRKNPSWGGRYPSLEIDLFVDDLNLPSTSSTSSERSWISSGAACNTKELHAPMCVLLGYRGVVKAERRIWVFWDHLLPGTSWRCSYKTYYDGRELGAASRRTPNEEDFLYYNQILSRTVSMGPRCDEHGGWGTSDSSCQSAAKDFFFVMGRTSTTWTHPFQERLSGVSTISTTTTASQKSETPLGRRPVHRHNRALHQSIWCRWLQVCIHLGWRSHLDGAKRLQNTRRRSTRTWRRSSELWSQKGGRSDCNRRSTWSTSRAASGNLWWRSSWRRGASKGPRGWGWSSWRWGASKGPRGWGWSSWRWGASKGPRGWGWSSWRWEASKGPRGWGKRKGRKRKGGVRDASFSSCSSYVLKEGNRSHTCGDGHDSTSSSWRVSHWPYPQWPGPWVSRPFQKMVQRERSPFDEDTRRRSKSQWTRWDCSEVHKDTSEKDTTPSTSRTNMVALGDTICQWAQPLSQACQDPWLPSFSLRRHGQKAKMEERNLRDFNRDREVSLSCPWRTWTLGHAKGRSSENHQAHHEGNTPSAGWRTVDGAGARVLGCLSC